MEDLKSSATPIKERKSKHKKPEVGAFSEISVSASDRGFILRDGFNARDFFDDFGNLFAVDLFLEMLGWDIRNENAGDGITIKCPNHLEHSEPDDGSDPGCWCCPSNGENPFLIMCHHNHCRDLYTWHFLKLIEDRLEEGEAALPDEYRSLSEMICDEIFYPEVEGRSVSPHPQDYGATYSARVEFLGTPRKVEQAFADTCGGPRSGEEDYAALFAGVELGGSKGLTMERLLELIKSEGRYNSNDIARLKKQGSALAKEKRAEIAKVREMESSKRLCAAMNDGFELAHPSNDIADPLGDTMEEAIATLAKRWRVVSVSGKVRFLHVPNSDDLTERKIALETMSRADFELFHEDRKIRSGKDYVNPAEVFVEHAPRYSGIEFAPPPVEPPGNAYNLYRGRSVVPQPGNCEHIKGFILNTVCRGREDLFRFVWLYLAHLVQRPGEKPQTAIVLRGEGGCGKSTFGLVLERLSAPYCLTISEEEHVTGRFAGAHLATSLAAVCTEALFAGDPKVNGKIKSLVTSETILVEPKGLPVVQMPSYTRLFFDSNNERVVPIDGNGSERRYLVMEVNDDHKNDAAYFDPIYSELNGEGISALAWELMNYDPATDNMRWQDLRVAPDTPERRRMRWHSMRPVERSIIRMIEDGMVVMRSASGQTFRYTFEPGKPIRLPQPELRLHLASSMNRHEARDGDIKELFEGMFGETVPGLDGTEYIAVQTPRGTIKCEEFVASSDAKGDKWDSISRSRIRCFELPPVEVLQSVLANKFNRSLNVEGD